MVSLGKCTVALTFQVGYRTGPVIYAYQRQGLSYTRIGIILYTRVDELPTLQMGYGNGARAGRDRGDVNTM